MYTMDRHKYWYLDISLPVGNIDILCSDVVIVADAAAISSGRSATEEYTIMGEVRCWGLVSCDGHICAVQQRYYRTNDI